MKYDEVKKHFKNPEAIDRSAPFWSWNDKMDHKEVKNQAHDMIQKGMGGYFMHSRVGLETEYLGQEWMDCVKACVQQAKEDNTYAWLYDEDRWPSGAAGGLVTRGKKEFASKGISAHLSDDRLIADCEILYSYAIIIENDKLVSVRLLDNTEEKNQNEKYLHISIQYHPSSAWYNDTPPADNINKDCVKSFIDITMGAYKNAVGEYFGKEIPGVFTDEPNISIIKGCFPYTYELPDFFKEKRGYEFSGIVPYLFFEGDLSLSARHDFFRTIYEMFAQNFSKQFYDWCNENNLLFTGHYLAENRMGDYIFLSGGVLLNYMYQHIPGIDMLGDFTNEYMTIKGCTSVANQTGRNRTLSETYGVSGWEFSFEGQKWIGDYQYIQGINLRCQHLAWYSMRGMRKRDYPPQFNYQTSWWKYNNMVEDYFARLGAITSKGKVIRDTLMIHPLSTAWIKTKLDTYEPGNNIGFDLNDYTKNMMSNHIDFDYGDEDVIERIGRIDKDKFIVGKASYGNVIIPPGVETLYRNTVKLLIEFMNNDGKVICEGCGIKYIEGKKDKLVNELINHSNFIVTDNLHETVNYLNRVVWVRTPAGTEDNDIFCMVRDYDDARILFMINNNKNDSKEVFVRMEGEGLLEEWDPLTSDISKVPYRAIKGHVEFNCTFGPCDSKLYVLDRKKEHKSVEADREMEYKVIRGLGITCPFERTDKNVLVLDMCQMKLDDGEWSEVDDLWRNQKKVRESLDMIPVHINEGVQRYLWVNESHKNDGKKLSISFTFNADYLPENIQLCAEDIENFSIKLNDYEVENKKAGWFVDKCMGVVDLKGLKQGENILVLECKYYQKTELENVYLIGDFAVTPDRVIAKEPANLRIGDWGLQGYLHYHSAIKYKYTFEYKEEMGRDIILDFGKYSAVVAFVRLNGNEIPVPWKSKAKVSIGQYLVRGNNHIEIEVMASPRNMFGPLHLSNTREKWNGCRALHPFDNMYTKDYTLYPWGIMEQICIYGR